MIRPQIQKLQPINLLTVKVHDNDLVMNIWDYDDLIMIGSFIGLVLVNERSISY